MGERPRKKPQRWKKAVLHFCMCFFIGFFTGFAPATSGDKPTPHASNATFSEVLPTVPILVGESPATTLEEVPVDVVSHRQLILVTPTTSGGDPLQLVLLRRLAGTVRLVPPPLTWIVVEKESGSEKVSEMLRKTGVMYRHLVVKENFTAAEVEMEMEHQRNVALKHVEHHRLVGVVHFAELSNVYDLDFFRELRQIEVFGTWPMAVLSDERDKVVIEGPVCDSSQVIGWHLKKMNNETDNEKPRVHISSFAFNSSILWDPERWGRPSSTQGAAQDSMKFVKDAMNEDESSVKGVAGEKCSRILLWHLFHFPTSTLSLLASDNNNNTSNNVNM